MVHLCKKIKELSPSDVEVVVVPLIRLKKGSKYIQNILYFFWAIKFLFRLKRKDKVFLMEYMMPTHNQYIMAKLFRLLNKEVSIYGLAHLVPKDFDIFFSAKKRLLKWVEPIDKLITFGTSLSDYFLDRGVSNNRIFTSFHYVDTSYYFNKQELLIKDRELLKVIIIGNMKRDYDSLYRIVVSNQNLRFILCKGKENIDYFFSGLSNVTLVGYVPEDELRELMREADISLNVLYDTVGSNAIVASMAMGLAILTSDVGSIRDYCSSQNAIFCDNNDLNTFTYALQYLSDDREKLLEMKKASLSYAQNLSVEKFYSNIRDL